MLEIERKWLIYNLDINQYKEKISEQWYIEQYYIGNVRYRKIISNNVEKYLKTIKLKTDFYNNTIRKENEIYILPYEYDNSKFKISKNRYIIPLNYDNLNLELDVFITPTLWIIGEIEFKSVEHSLHFNIEYLKNYLNIDILEVTNNSLYYNENIYKLKMLKL